MAGGGLMTRVAVAADAAGERLEKGLQSFAGWWYFVLVYLLGHPDRPCGPGSHQP
jgi:hypothetical protein